MSSDAPFVPRAVSEGMSLTHFEAEALEAKLLRAPDDVDARSRLIGYYALAAIVSEEKALAQAEHVLWLIANAPHAEVLATPFGSPAGDAALAVAGRLWRANVERMPRDAKVLAHATRFFSEVDRPYAEQLRYRLQLVDPELWASFPLEYELRAPEVPDEAAPRARSDLEADLAAAWRERDLPSARSLAERLLAGAAAAAGTWAQANALHVGHVVLGLVDLEEGNVAGAKRHLLLSAEHEGSPQLHTFGPDTSLAGALVEAGELTAVADYLERCRGWWQMGHALIDAWTHDLRAGRRPHFLPTRWLA